MNPYLYVALAAMSPILELRGAIPLGLGLHLDLSRLMFVSIASNIAVIPIAFIALKLARFRELIFRLLGGRTSRKIAMHRRRLELWGELALIPFVAIPVPLSGAYTGILIAETLGLNRFRSSLTIAIGVCIAAAIVMLTSLGFIKVF